MRVITSKDFPGHMTDKTFERLSLVIRAILQTSQPNLRRELKDVVEDLKLSEAKQVGAILYAEVCEIVDSDDADEE